MTEKQWGLLDQLERTSGPDRAWVTPTILGMDMGSTYDKAISFVHRKLQVLVAHGFAERLVFRGWYRLTEMGAKALETRRQSRRT